MTKTVSVVNGVQFYTEEKFVNGTEDVQTTLRTPVIFIMQDGRTVVEEYVLDRTEGYEVKGLTPQEFMNDGARVHELLNDVAQDAWIDFREDVKEIKVLQYTYTVDHDKMRELLD